MGFPRPTRKQLYVGLVSVAAIAIIGGSAGWYFATEAAQQDYLTNVLLSFCAGLLVSLVFTLLIQSILSEQSSVELLRHQQIATATALYERFHSPEMIEIRCRVDRLLLDMESNPGSLDAIHKRLYLNRKNIEAHRDWVALSAMLHFYENLADMIERGMVDQQTTADNFKKYYRWFREHPSLNNSIDLSKGNNENWYCFSRFEYLEREAGF
jgi:hypothetical protein